MRPAKTQISLHISTVRSEASLCAELVAKDPRLFHVDSKGSDQNGQMSRLIRVYAVRTSLLVLSCCRPGSVARLDAHQPGMRTVAGSILVSGKTFFH